ncbi:hypothetical protein C6571_01385 [Simplicispira suum]|uniref:DUF2946 domain-containing protein n=2 Tax=Simplicispira suum TaxID=2109915 RepID=A0A2S0MW62_9BURK|nr:hypothetical protein C6571_01385 [Simplicispira suum]
MVRGMLHAGMRRLLRCLALSLLVLRMLLGADVALAAGQRCAPAAAEAAATHCADGDAVTLACAACADCLLCHAVALPLPGAAGSAGLGAPLPAAQADWAFASAALAPALKPPIARRVA